MNTQYLTEKQVSKMTARPLSTLRNDRHLGRGFPYVKIGRAVRYSTTDILTYMEARKVTPQDG